MIFELETSTAIHVGNVDARSNPPLPHACALPRAAAECSPMTPSAPPSHRPLPRRLHASRAAAAQ